MRSIVALSGALVLLGLSSCTSPSGDGPDAGSPSTQGDGGDAGVVDAGPQKCTSDLTCADEQYCEVATGACLDARSCTTNDGCWWADLPETDYCAFGACFCDPDRGGGRCRPRLKPCASCTRDLECGDDGFIYLDYVAKCVDFQGAKVCLPQRPVCPPGYRVGAGNNCEPGGGSCSAVGACTTNADCDPTSAKPECDTSRGFCIPSCLFDYTLGTSDCPPGQRCNVDPRLLTASNPNFGGGKCGAACDGEGAPACESGTECVPDGDARLVSPLPRRCRPASPKCVRDQDCPADPDGHSKGFCDPGTLSCMGGCRRETDCDQGFRCAEGQCTQKTCIEGGGANLACARGAFCCGETNSHQPCAAGVNVGECYPAPNPPWCQTCTTVGKATTPQGPTRPQQSWCAPFKDKKLLWHSCDPRVSAMCPRSYKCEKNAQFCESDADCGAGGKCGDVQDADGNKFKACVCNEGQACPSTAECIKDDDGNGTVCGAYWCRQDDCIPPT